MYHAFKRKTKKPEGAHSSHNNFIHEYPNAALVRMIYRPGERFEKDMDYYFTWYSLAYPKRTMVQLAV